MAAAVDEAEKAAAALPGPERGCKLVTAPVKGRKSFICFDEDATVKSVKQAIDKGFDVPELVKTLRRCRSWTGPERHPRGTTCPCSWPNTRLPAPHPNPRRCVRRWCPPFWPPTRATTTTMFKRTPMHYDQSRRRRHLPQHRRLAAGPLLLQGLRLQRRNSQRAQQRGHARRLHPGQVPHPRPRCLKGPAAGLCVGHEQSQGMAASSTRPCATTTAASSTTAWWSSWAKTTTTSLPPPAGPARPGSGFATTPASTAGISVWST